MPAMDRTGPMGMGPMTGGGRGRCNPYLSKVRPPMRGYSPFRSFDWGIPYGLGTYPLNPFAQGFRAFPRLPFGFGRGQRRRWW